MVVEDEERSDDVRAAVQRRAVPTLVTSQALGGIGVASGIAVGSLLARDLSGSTTMAGLSQTATVLGAAVLAVPLARYAQRAGRRPALVVGYLLGLSGALLVLLAAEVGRFSLLMVGSLLFGGATAAGLQARYAATDAAAPSARGRSLSLVVWATTVGVVVGPNLSDAGGALGRQVGLPVLSGPYLFSVAAFAAAAAVVTLRLRPDPLELRTTPAGAEDVVGQAAGSIRDSVRAIVATPLALLGLAAICAAHAVMVGVMVMTPVHLVDHGATLRVVGLIISAHVIGMYAASPVFGWLSDRAGRIPTVLLGLALLAVSLVVAGGSQSSHGRAGMGLLVLGLGWSACLVAGSTLVTESVPDQVRTAVQGVSDLLMGLSGALAGALAGVALGLVGFAGLNAAAALLLAPVVVLAVAGARSGPVRRASGAGPAAPRRAAGGPSRRG